MIIEVSMIKNYPPTNLNRDNNERPKEAVYGGVTRGRISSQCIKRTLRESEMLGELINTNKGIRTRQVGDLVIEQLEKLGVTVPNNKSDGIILIENYFDNIKELISKLGREKSGTKDITPEDSKDIKKYKYITKQLIFYSPDDIKVLALGIKELIETSESLEEFKKKSLKDLSKLIDDADIRPITLDIAIFGRMQTTSLLRLVDSSIQVADAIGVNSLVQKTDFYTALDDLLGRNEGAAMTGNTEFNSNCYYHYLSIDTDQLINNLDYTDNAKELALQSVLSVIKAFAYTNPTGKQNSFAGHVLPDLMMIEMKTMKVPLNYSSAYVKPAENSEGKTLVENSIKQLVKEVNTLDNAYGLEMEKRVWLNVRNAVKPKNCTKVKNINNILAEVAEVFKEVHMK